MFGRNEILAVRALVCAGRAVWLPCVWRFVHAEFVLCTALGRGTVAWCNVLVSCDLDTNILSLQPINAAQSDGMHLCTVMVLRLYELLGIKIGRAHRVRIC
jgi:hypothetical protein